MFDQRAPRLLFGGVRIAQRTSAAGLTFLHTDHVGSIRLTTSAANAWQSYNAFGCQ